MGTSVYHQQRVQISMGCTDVLGRIVCMGSTSHYQGMHPVEVLSFAFEEGFRQYFDMQLHACQFVGY